MYHVFKNMLLLYQYIINYQEVDSNKSFFKESYHERFEGLRPSCSCVYEPALWPSAWISDIKSYKSSRFLRMPSIFCTFLRNAQRAMFGKWIWSIGGWNSKRQSNGDAYRVNYQFIKMWVAAHDLSMVARSRISSKFVVILLIPWSAPFNMSGSLLGALDEVC